LRFTFIEAHRKRFRIARMCQDLNVSKAGYYDWRRREPSKRRIEDWTILEHIQRIHKKSRGRYGRLPIHADLKDLDIFTSRKRVARLMRLAGLKGKKRHRSKAASLSPGTIAPAPNRLKRRFSPRRPNRAWVTDITYLPTKQGWLYLAVVLDCFSRRVVGWSTSKNIDSDLVLTALKRALLARPYDKLLVHSDRGSQYGSREYMGFLKKCGVRASMSRKGNCWDNAVAESFFATLKGEIKPERTWETRGKAASAIDQYIDSWYNRERRHSANGYLSPIAFEKLCVA
jgi:transposase InsO family protein